MSYIKRKQVSFRVAYLIGVADEILKSNYTECDELYKNLKNSKEASTIRYLSKLRTALMKNFKRTDEEMRFHLKNINSIEWFNDIEISKLESWGINVIQVNCRAETYSIHFCKLIEANIDNCRFMFPDWVNWDYIRSLFLIPKYNKKNVLISEFEKFRTYMSFYPYSMYIYWEPFDCKGMLIDDELFLKSLYSLHNDKFLDKSKYVDVSSSTIDNIYGFIENSKKVAIVVDCENTDVYKLYGFLNTLDEDVVNKIDKVILYDDANTVETWKVLSKYISIPTEYNIVERILENKSLVDIKMATGICKSHYCDNVDSFIIVSSDSDYWGVISSLPEAKFMVVFEDLKASNVSLNNLLNNNILACSLDEFYSGSTDKLKEDVLLKTANKRLDSISFNCKDLLNEIYTSVRINASEEEKEAFYNKYLKGIKVTIDSEGNFKIKAGN